MTPFNKSFTNVSDTIARSAQLQPPGGREIREMRSLRILQVCSADSVGGGERHVIDLTRALAERGHELHLAVRRSSPFRDLLADDRVHWHELPLRNATDIQSSRRLGVLLRAHEIDLLHGHVARDYPLCGLAARMTGANLFLTRHHFRPFAKSLLYQWAINPVRNLIAVSTSVAQGLAESFPDLADRIVVIPNWIDARAVGTISRAESRDLLGIRLPIAVGLVGQISAIKRQDLLVKAAARLKTAGLTNINFLLIGEAGPKDRDYEEHLRALARQLDVADKVIFTGYVPGFARYLNALDLVVAPSENEGFSLAVIEAMAARLPVIATRVGGPSEIIDHGLTGLLVPPGELEALVEAMSHLLSDQALSNQLAEAAAVSVRTRFDREGVIDRIEGLYLRGIS